MEFKYSENDQLSVSSTREKIQEEVFNAKCRVLTEIRECGQLCDVQIKVGEESFPTHRVILSASSPYFRAMFTNSQFVDPNQQVIQLEQVSADTIRSIIRYAYTQQCDISAENVESLLVAADYFNIVGLLSECCQFLASQLSAENCIGIEKFASWYACSELEQIAHNFFMENFVEIYRTSEEFLHLEPENLCRVIASDDLNVKSEEIAFDAIIHWVDFDPIGRTCYMAKLLGCLRLGLFSTYFFVEKVKEHRYVKDNTACRPLIIETLKFLCDLDRYADARSLGNFDISSCMLTPRMPHGILFVFGGWNVNSPTNIIETYDIRSDSWMSCQTAESDYRAYHGTCVLDGLIYIIGGFDGMEYFNSVICFDPVKQRWLEVAPMYSKRCYVSAVILGGHIYAMGGSDGHTRQSTAERYDKNRNQWSFIQPMHQQRSDASATILDGNIYICGGFDGVTILNSAEFYTPEIDQWTLITPMLTPRSGIRVLTYKNTIYAIGGFNGVIRLNTIERYNEKSKAWEPGPEMSTARSNFAIEILDDTIYAMGGFNGHSTISSVEYFDIDNEQWYGAADLNVRRSALSACVLKGLPNAKSYVPSRSRVPIMDTNDTAHLKDT